jgi:DNA mismatch repair protein MutL
MGRIRVLPDAVANKIAAGEVVERPASVLKELLENALDAGATEIRVEVEGGGRRLIRVADNGCGMLRDDALLAFERHATSKLRDVDDLLSIATLGFRGEALPSIASVSRLLLETKSADESTGTAVEFAGGRLLRCDEAALPGGTTVTVRDLFFNVPARRKFLRSEQTELAHIGSLATQYSLAHPSRSFSLRHGASDLLSVSPVADLRDRVYQVFGGQILDSLVDLGYHEQTLQLGPPDEDNEEGEKVFCLRGFVSRPQVQKLNRNSIYLFVNGRLIRDKLLLHALSSAYHNLMPAGCYPFALLFLDCDCEEVDVNVHPSKTEVRFRHGSLVHDFVRDTVRGVLMEQRPVSAIPPAHSPQPAATLPYSEFTQTLQVAALEQAVKQPPEELPVIRVSGPSLKTTVPDTHGSFPAEAAPNGAGSMHSLDDLRPLGQIHNSFIIAAGKDGLWIIDQHVAHERILFEKVLKQRGVDRVERQQLLMPIVLELSAAQQFQYSRIAGELNATGFETEPFGHRTIAVKSAPADLGAGDIERVIFEVLEIGEDEMRSLSTDDLRRGIAASIACRAAIKINTHLDEAKIDWLLSALSKTDYPMSCPHGRPVALRYSTREILKGFQRI